MTVGSPAWGVDLARAVAKKMEPFKMPHDWCPEPWVLECILRAYAAGMDEMQSRLYEQIPR